MTGHPAVPYHQELKGFIQPIKTLNPNQAKKAMICGFIQTVRRVLTKRGKKLAIRVNKTPFPLFGYGLLDLNYRFHCK